MVWQYVGSAIVIFLCGMWAGFGVAREIGRKK